MRSIDLLGLTDGEIARILARDEDNVTKTGLVIGRILRERPDIIILFPSQSLFEGSMFDKHRPRDRLIYIEKRLYEEALGEGYHETRYFDLGGSEKALLLERD
jgi:hypothetical protein